MLNCAKCGGVFHDLDFLVDHQSDQNNCLRVLYSNGNPEKTENKFNASFDVLTDPKNKIQSHSMIFEINR